jgi:zinc D-Ala-D-Ala carboxypeptidase
MELKYFKLSEFDSPDLPGSGVNMKPEFLQRLDNARSIANIPFKITSGYRTAAHNKSLKDKGHQAVPNSPHLSGFAADIAIPNAGSRERFIIVRALIHAGFTRIGISKTFVHCDCDPTKDKEVIWLY